MSLGKMQTNCKAKQKVKKWKLILRGIIKSIVGTLKLKFTYFDECRQKNEG